LERSVCSILTGIIRRKNNQDEIVGVFLLEKDWFKNSLTQSKGGAGGHVRVDKWAVEGKDPKWRAVIQM
jgi:hypothetical protein